MQAIREGAAQTESLDTTAERSMLLDEYEKMLNKRIDI
jgi:hypothetical protein